MATGFTRVQSKSNQFIPLLVHQVHMGYLCGEYGEYTAWVPSPEEFPFNP